MKKKFKIDIIDFIIGSITVTGLVFLSIYSYKYVNVMEERECINYYLETGYILKECTNYDNLKK